MLDTRSRRWSRLTAALLAVCLVLPLFGCKAGEEPPAPPDPVQTEDLSHPATEVERLSKLCRVWGYVKYTHPAFLLGERDWDQDLLALIPQVREKETHEEVNALLHEWFAGLGEIDYGTNEPVAFWADAAAEDRLVITDASWTTDAAYLGEELAGDLGQLGEIPNISRRKAPVTMLYASRVDVFYPSFGREQKYPDMDFSDTGYRLLGLFRVWNIMAYYFPYHDLLEGDWTDCLDELVPRMMEGSDEQSYNLTICALLARLHDNHVSLFPGGSGYAPVPVTEVDGKLVVSGTAEGCPLALGDVILQVNGQTVEDGVEMWTPYISSSREDGFSGAKAIMILSIMGGNDEQVEVTVLRDGKEETLPCRWVPQPAYNVSPQEPYLVLEGNIGWINPELFSYVRTCDMMNDLRSTVGLIIDLRQYPPLGMYGFSSYFTTEYTPVFLDASPSGAVPGAYVRVVHSAGYRPGDEAQGVYHYGKPVVVLVNGFTQSAGELAAWSLSNGKNVVLMGQNTSGALNHVAEVPIPGGRRFTYTAVRAELDDGGQIQRVGLTPDIPVSPTIQGITEGRDELMEAAVQYIREAA